MSATQFQAIVLAEAALLTAAPALAGGRVVEGRELALASDVASQINVFLNDSRPDAEIVITGAPVDWSSDVAIVIRTRKDLASGDSAETVADALLFDVWSRVMADQSLGGLVQSLAPGDITRDRDSVDPDVAAFTWNFTVTHRSTQNSLA